MVTTTPGLQVTDSDLESETRKHQNKFCSNASPPAQDMTLTETTEFQFLPHYLPHHYNVLTPTPTQVQVFEPQSSCVMFLFKHRKHPQQPAELITNNIWHQIYPKVVNTIDERNVQKGAVVPPNHALHIWVCNFPPETTCVWTGIFAMLTQCASVPTIRVVLLIGCRSGAAGRSS